MGIAAAEELAIEDEPLRPDRRERRAGGVLERRAEELPAEEGVLVPEPLLALAEADAGRVDADRELRAVDLLERDPGRSIARAEARHLGKGEELHCATITRVPAPARGA
ncbi:hypothetical protein WME74_05435 [Sorangium sp. So ce341]